MKKIGKYIIITLLLLLGLCCVGVLYLFFIPNSSLFNITYINHNNKTSSKQYSIEDVDTISLSSRAYAVNILPAQDEHIVLTIEDHSFGFVLTKNKKTTLSENVNNKTLNFEVKESYGFSINNNSEINLYIPTTKAINLNLTNTKSNTTINSNKLTVKNLTYKTNEGDFNFKNGNISGNLNLSISKGDFSVSKSVITSNNNIKLSISTGKFLAEASVFGDIEIVKNKRGVIKVKQCNILKEEISSAGGQIYANEAYHVNVYTSDTIIKIGNITHAALINLTGTGSVKINSLAGESYIFTNSGNINISNCESSVSVHSDEGNISVLNAKQTVSLDSNYGDCVVKFSEDAESYNPEATIKTRTLYARLYNGKLTATGVEHIGVANENNLENFEGVTITGNGRVHITMTNVVGNNSVVGERGQVDMKIEHSAVYKLTTNPNEKTQGSVRVNLLQISEYRGYTTQTMRDTYVNHESTDVCNNTLTVSTTSGDITITDNKVS